MNFLPLVAAYACVLTGGLQLVLHPFRARLGLLAAQYALVTWLIAEAVPFQLAATKLIAGFLTCGILALSAIRTNLQPAPEVDSKVRMLAVVLVAVASPSLGRIDWLGIPNLSPQAALGSTALMLLGLIQLALSQAPLRAVSSMVTVLSGFEIVYSLVEPSLVVFALLAAVHIGLGLVGSVLLMGAKE